MAKKRFKSKKRNKKHTKIKVLLVILCVYLISNLTFSILKNNKITINNKEFIKTLLDSSNNIVKKDYDKNKIINNIVKFFSKVDINNPVTALNYDISNNVVKVDNGTHEDNYDNISELEKVSQYIEDPRDEKINDPIVYLYNSHQLENYSSSNLEVYNIKPNVMLASYMLREKLNEAGINTIVEEENVTEILRVNNWSGSSAYKVTKMLINDARNKNKKLNYFIDLHRDSVSRDKTTIKIGDKNYARFYFLIGLENENYKENMKIAMSLSEMLNTSYKGISKGILQKQGKGVNGVYNQDIHKNVVLIEIGGVDNTIDEVKNSIDVLSEVLIKYIKGDTNENK